MYVIENKNLTIYPQNLICFLDYYGLFEEILWLRVFCEIRVPEEIKVL